MEDNLDFSSLKVTYRCRRCRTHLFGERDIVDGGGRCLQCSSKEKYETSSSPPPVLFLHEEIYLPWIQQSVEKASWTRGKLACPKCKGRLGSFDFISPNKCEKGIHIISCIQVITSRVDRCTPSPPVARIRPFQKQSCMSESDTASPSHSPKHVMQVDSSATTDTMCYRSSRIQNCPRRRSFELKEDGKLRYLRLVSSFEEPAVRNIGMSSSQKPKRQVQSTSSFEQQRSTLSSDLSLDNVACDKNVRGVNKKDMQAIFATSPIDDPILFTVLGDRPVDPDDPFEMREESSYRSPRWKRKKKFWRSSQSQVNDHQRRNSSDDEHLCFTTGPPPLKNEPVRVSNDYMEPIQSRQSPRRYREVDSSSPSFFNFDRTSNYEVQASDMLHFHQDEGPENTFNDLEEIDGEDTPVFEEPDEFLLTWELDNQFGGVETEITAPRLRRVEEKKERNRRKKERRKHRKWMSKQEQEAEIVTITKEEFEEAAGFSLNGRTIQEVTTCPVCLELFFKPCVCSPCNHIFCDPCLRQLAHFQPRDTPCPLCRTTIEVCCPHEAMNKTMQVLFPLQTKRRQCAEKKFVNSMLPGKRGFSAWMSPLSRRIWIRQARRGPFWAIQDPSGLNAYHDFGRRWCFAIWWWVGAWGYLMFIIVFFISSLFVISEYILPTN